MDAPIYPPASHFVQPARVAVPFGIDTTSIEELLAVPATREIVFAALPSLKFSVNAPQLKPHLNNFTLRDLAGYGAFSADTLPKLDEELRALPADQRPAL